MRFDLYIPLTKYFCDDFEYLISLSGYADVSYNAAKSCYGENYIRQAHSEIACCLLKTGYL